jgi:hypothetical protein
MSAEALIIMLKKGKKPCVLTSLNRLTRLSRLKTPVRKAHFSTWREKYFLQAREIKNVGFYTPTAYV